MTAAINETTSRLKSLEDTNSSIKIFLESVNSRIDDQQATLAQQSTDIAALGTAFQTPNQLISSLQQAQLQQGTTMEQMSTVQNDLVSKISQLVNATKPPPANAEDRTAAETNDA